MTGSPAKMGRAVGVVVAVLAALAAAPTGGNAASELTHSAVSAAESAHPNALGPATWTWPSVDCSETLQDCINHALDGDTVLIARNGAVNEAITLTDRSLSLRAAPGYDPEIAGALRMVANSGRRRVHLAHFTVHGQLYAGLFGGANHVITLDHVRVLETNGNGAISHAAVELDTEVPATIRYTRGVVTNTQPQADGITLDAFNPTGLVTFKVIGVSVHLDTAPSSEGGIQAYARGSGGQVLMQLYNDVVWSAANCNCGNSAGIQLLGGSTANAIFDVVGNTIDRLGPRNVPGLDVDDRLDPSGHMSVLAFDNSITNVHGYGLTIGTVHPSTLAFRAGHNEYFGNTHGNLVGGHSIGGGNLYVAPRYVDEAHGRLALKSFSPLIDAGLTCSPGGVADPDAAGRNRLAGASVDMGAYERRAGAPGLALVGSLETDMLTGGPGDDILCGSDGADLLIGNGGNDYLDGGNGADQLFGGDGRDRMYGRNGADTVCGNDGRAGDLLNGGPGVDGFRADPGDVRVSVEQDDTCQMLGE